MILLWSRNLLRVWLNQLKMKESKLIQSIDGFNINKMRIKDLPGGWSTVPNIIEMNISKYKTDKKWEAIGIEKCEKRSIETKKYVNNRMNRYLRYQIKRLLKSNPEKFWFICWKLMEKSYTFLILILNDTTPNWYKNQKAWRVKLNIRKFQKLVKDRNPDLDFKRVYIPKENSKIRKLGVPTIPYRMILNGYNRFLLMFLNDKIHKNAHGFLPGRGTASCWRELVNKLDRKYILETDLTKFFDNVVLDNLYKKISKDGLPNNELVFLANLNNRTPTLPKNYDKEDWFQGGINKLIKQIEEDDDDELMIGEPFFKYKMKNHPITHTDEWKSELKNKSWIVLRGTPQGAAHSPICSIYTLKNFLEQQESLSYADDPIFFGDAPFAIKEFKEEGIEINKDKTRWIKRNGEFQGDFKYLGIKLTKSLTLENCTRTKKEFKITHEDRMLILKNIFGEKRDLSPMNSLKTLANSSAWGYIVASLYNGGFSKKHDQDFRMNPNPQSILGNLRSRLGKVRFLNLVNTANSSSISVQLLKEIISKRRVYRFVPSSVEH